MQRGRTYRKQHATLVQTKTPILSPTCARRSSATTSQRRFAQTYPNSRLERDLRVVNEVEIPLHSSRREEDDYRAPPIRCSPSKSATSDPTRKNERTKVAHFLPPTNEISLLDRLSDRTHEHRANRNERHVDRGRSRRWHAEERDCPSR